MSTQTTKKKTKKKRKHKTKTKTKSQAKSASHPVNNPSIPPIIEEKASTTGTNNDNNNDSDMDAHMHNYGAACSENEEKYDANNRGDAVPPLNRPFKPITNIIPTDDEIACFDPVVPLNRILNQLKLDHEPSEYFREFHDQLKRYPNNPVIIRDDIKTALVIPDFNEDQNRLKYAEYVHCYKLDKWVCNCNDFLYTSNRRFCDHILLAHLITNDNPTNLPIKEYNCSRVENECDKQFVLTRVPCTR